MSEQDRTQRQIEFLRGRYEEDRRTAEADDRHWSEVPSRLFSAHRALQDVVAKTVALDALARCADYNWVGSWAVVTVAREAIHALVQPYADAEAADFDPAWRLPPVNV